MPLSALFKRSLDEGTVPKDWKLATVVPIFKQGNKQEPGNYRPISLTSIIGKVLESIVKDALLNHLVSQNLLSPYQFGFRPLRSCESQLLEVMNNWTKLLEDKSSVDTVYLDLRKAFDSVPHKRLILKLKSYGVRGKVLRWTEDFLADRYQRVIVQSSLSDWVHVSSGVPQGSVLGPLLFLLYINDLPDCVSCKISMFADDTKLYASSSSPLSVHALQTDIQNAFQWSVKWQMPFNSNKCVTLQLGHPGQEHTYCINNTDLKNVVVEKDLGVMMDSDLKFKEQAASAVLKATRVLAVIKRTMACLDTRTLPLLYTSLVRPLLEYGNAVWGPFNRADQIRVEKVQRRATRMISSLRGIPYTDRLRTLRLPSLYYRRRRGDVIRVYQLIHGGIDQDYTSFFAIDTQTRTRGHPWKICKPNAVSRARRNFFAVRVINDWNSLPVSVVSAPSLNIFKSRLDAHWAAYMFHVPELE